MKILLNIIIAVLWCLSLSASIGGVDHEARRIAIAMAFIIICIFCAKELIIYEIEKLKPRQREKD